MATSITTRTLTSPNEGFKSPCVVSSSSDITLSGTQTIDGLAVVAGDRVLVRTQTDTTENGIYDVATSAWTRATDFNAADDLLSGIMTTDSNSAIIYICTFTGDWVVGTTALTWSAQVTIAEDTVVANKAAAVLLTPAANTTLFVNGTGGGFFYAVVGAATSTYSDDDATFCGNEFIPTGGDGSAGWLRADSDSVVSIAALRLLAGGAGQHISTLGYYAIGDGAKSDYYWHTTSTATDNGLTIIKVTAVATGRWLLIHDGTVSAKQAGAKGDGSTDDAVSIQAALDLGLKVYANTDVFIVSPITIDVDGTEFYGDGTIKLIASAAGSSSVITVTADYCKVEGLVIDSNSVTNARSIRFTGTVGGMASKLRGLNNGQGFIYADGIITNLSVLNCETESFGYGVWIQEPSAGSSGLVIQGCKLSFPFGSGQGDGIELNCPTNGFKDVVINGNYITGYWGNTLSAGIGIGLANIENAGITGNTILDCENDGIHVEDTSLNITISGNTIRNCCRTTTNASGGILLSGSSEISVTGNSIYNSNTKASITFFSANTKFVTDCTIIGNVMNGAYKAALSIDSVKNLIIANNTIIDADTSATGSQSAINILKTGTNISERIKIIGNIIKDGSNAVTSVTLAATTCNYLDIESNDFSGCTTGAPFLDPTSNIFETRGNRIGVDDMSGTITVTVSTTTTTITNDNAYDNKHIAIWPLNAGAATLTSAHISTVTKGTSFVVTHASAAGAESFGYMIL